MSIYILVTLWGFLKASWLVLSILAIIYGWLKWLEKPKAKVVDIDDPTYEHDARYHWKSWIDEQ